MTGVTKVKCYVLKILASISLLESITWIPIEILYVHGHLRITQWYGYVACVQTPTISPGVGDGGTQGKFGQKRCAAEIFKPRLFLRQKSLTSLDLNQLIGCLQTSTRCFKRQKISSPHVESCLFTITDFVAEARKKIISYRTSELLLIGRGWVKYRDLLVVKQRIHLRDTDKSRYFAIIEFNNCFIIRSSSLFFNKCLLL